MIYIKTTTLTNIKAHSWPTTKWNLLNTLGKNVAANTSERTQVRRFVRKCDFRIWLSDCHQSGWSGLQRGADGLPQNTSEPSQLQDQDVLEIEVACPFVSPHDSSALSVPE